jgi:tetratricopeptide (TPR) repeat protein
LALVKLGKYNESIACYYKAANLTDGMIRADPKNEHAWEVKGDSLFGLGKYNESIESYNRSIELDPTDPKALRGKGDSLAKLGRYSESLALYDRATETILNMQRLGMTKAWL